MFSHMARRLVTQSFKKPQYNGAIRTLYWTRRDGDFKYIGLESSTIDIFEGKFKHRKIISSPKDLDLLVKKESIGKLTNEKELNSLLNFSKKIYSPVNRSILNKIIKEVI